MPYAKLCEAQNYTKQQTVSINKEKDAIFLMAFKMMMPPLVPRPEPLLPLALPLSGKFRTSIPGSRLVEETGKSQTYTWLSSKPFI